MTALAVQGLSKSFGGLRVTANVNLMVEPGERRLIIGPNGAGKTTLFNLITGEIAPDSGSILLFDRNITRTPSHRRAHLGMARTYQIITLFPQDTILRNVTLALLGLSQLRWSPFIDVDQQHELISQAREALVRVGLDHIAHRPLSETSYGERRRVEIAMALAQSPRVLLLDHRRAARRARAAAENPARRHHRHDRAQHGRRPGLRRADHAFALRRGHRRGHARRSGGRPTDQRGLSWALALALSH
jgi:ABC-type branched-subunit amino acid transport system ATPase component